MQMQKTLVMLAEDHLRKTKAKLKGFQVQTNVYRVAVVGTVKKQHISS